MKEYLSQKGIQFKVRNVTLDEEARTDLISMGYRSTPVTVISGQKVVGYNPEKLGAALEAAQE